MGKVQASLRETDLQFIASQKVFFVATSPQDLSHHVNLSPKAPGDSVVVLDPHTVAYADLTGSGAETAAHVLENGRMTLLFCNLDEGPPRILRLYGRAKIIQKDEVELGLLERFPDTITASCGFRCVYVVVLERISTSCGYSLPVMQFVRQRETLNEWASKKGDSALKEYVTRKNSYSIDGLPSLGLLRNVGGDHCIIPQLEDEYVFGERIPKSDPRATQAKHVPSSQDAQYKAVKSHSQSLLALAFVGGVLSGCVLTVVAIRLSMSMVD